MAALSFNCCVDQTVLPNTTFSAAFAIIVGVDYEVWPVRRRRWPVAVMMMVARIN